MPNAEIRTRHAQSNVGVATAKAPCCGVGEESEVGRRDKQRGEISQRIAPENVYSTVDETMVSYTNVLSSPDEYHCVS